MSCVGIVSGCVVVVVFVYVVAVTLHGSWKSISGDVGGRGGGSCDGGSNGSGREVGNGVVSYGLER